MVEKIEENVTLVAMEEDAPSLSKHEIGSVVGGLYRLTRLLGSGANGTVYEAHHTLLERKVALKMLRPELRWEKDTLIRFTQEARSLAKLDHPNLIDLHEFGIDPDGTPFLVMDYEEAGVSLDKLLKERGRLSSEDVAEIGYQCADALQHAHEQNIIHRDIKPSNIILSRRGDRWHARIIDFGIIKVEGDQGITQTGAILGTPHYMSHEALQGSAPDARSDVYSLGATLFEALMGCPPYEAATAVELVHKQLNEPLPIMDEAAWPVLRQVITRSLNSDPSRRFQSMARLRDSLRRAQDQPEATRLEQWLREPLTRKRITAYATIATVVFVVASVCFGMYEGMMLANELRVKSRVLQTERQRNQTWYQLMLDAEAHAQQGDLRKAADEYQAALDLAPNTELSHRDERIQQTCEELLKVDQDLGRTEEAMRVQTILSTTKQGIEELQ